MVKLFVTCSSDKLGASLTVSPPSLHREVVFTCSSLSQPPSDPRVADSFYTSSPCRRKTFLTGLGTAVSYPWPSSLPGLWSLIFWIPYVSRFHSYDLFSSLLLILLKYILPFCLISPCYLPGLHKPSWSQAPQNKYRGYKVTASANIPLRLQNVAVRLQNAEQEMGHNLPQTEHRSSWLF